MRSKTLTTTSLFWIIAFQIAPVNFALSAPNQSCHKAFTPHCQASGSRACGTLSYAGYIGHLLQARQIDNNTLKNMIESARQGVILNPFSSQAAVTAAQHIHGRALQKMCEQTAIDVAKLAEALARLESQIHETESQRHTTKKNTNDLWVKPAFQLLEPEEFYTLYGPQKLEAFEVMNAPVTQRLWAEIMEQNPSHFRQGSDSVLIPIQGHQVIMQPNHPVENITWWSALVFANRYSEKMGLRPAYDLSQVSGWVGDAENGTLLVRVPIGMLPKVRIDISANGYRLPTEGQALLLVKRAREHIGSLNSSHLFVWAAGNSDGHTHAVDDPAIQPVLIQGHEFRDVRGNVSEWTEARSTTQASVYVYSDVTFKNSFWAPDGQRISFSPEAAGPERGLRLVRSLK